MHGRSWYAVVLIVALGVWFILGAANLYYGELNQDEGWYLYTARLTAEGLQPYRDYAFTQGPVFAHVYALANPFVERYGLMGGRLFTGLLGLVSIALSGWLAWRLIPGPGARSAAALAVILLSCNVYHSYFSIVVKTYSLSALLLVAGALCLTGMHTQAGRKAALFAGLFFALAAGVRLSAGIWLPIVGLYLLLHRHDWQKAWLSFGTGGLVGLLIAFGPSFVNSAEATWFWLVQYHTAREAGTGLDVWIYKAGFLSRFVQAYFVSVLMLLVLVIVPFTMRQRPACPKPMGVLWLGVAASTLIHVAAPFPYEDYQVILMPILSALIASGLVGLVQMLAPNAHQRAVKHAVVVFVLLASIAAAFSSPMNQAWVLRERDRIWWRLKETSDLGLLQETARWLNEQQGDGEMLLTQDTYLAVETGMTVPRGLEMGPFSYYPDWSREQAERRNVLNREMLIELLETTDAQWAAFSGYGLAIRSPDITELASEEQAELRAIVERRYEPVKTVPHFGQAHTDLEILRLRNPAPDALNPEP